MKCCSCGHEFDPDKANRRLVSYGLMHDIPAKTYDEANCPACGTINTVRVIMPEGGEDNDC